MKRDDVLNRFEAIRAEREAIREVNVHKYYIDHATVVRWIANARAALGTCFPSGHPTLREWDRTTTKAVEDRPELLSFYTITDTLTGLFDSAHDQLKAGHLSTLVDTIRTETEHELLDQAEDLASGDYVVAATVIAGGALETQLRHLCERSGIKWDGRGSIAKYDSAIGKERKAGGVEVYSKTDSKQVTAWGGMRNDAAHDPANFTKTAAEVRVMISGIRQFLDRVT